MLTDQEKVFCINYAKTLRLAQSVFKAFPDFCSQYTSALEAEPDARDKGNKLLDRPEISAYIEECKSSIAAVGRYSKEQHIMTLSVLRDDAHANGELKNAIDAEHKIGKALGFYVEQHMNLNIDGNRAANLDVKQIGERLKAMLEGSPAVAKRLGVSADMIDSSNVRKVECVQVDDERAGDGDEVEVVGE